MNRKTEGDEYKLIGESLQIWVQWCISLLAVLKVKEIGMNHTSVWMIYVQNFWQARLLDLKLADVFQSDEF